MKYIIRFGSERGNGAYLYVETPGNYCLFRAETRDEAVAVAETHTSGVYRIVRLLSHDEAKRKAVATELRNRAKKLRQEVLTANLVKEDALIRIASEDEARAQEIWPVKA